MMFWKRWFIVTMALIALQASNSAQANEYVTVDSIQLVRSGEAVQLIMRIDVDREQIDKNDVLLLAPVISSPEDSTFLPSLGVYGRNTYYYCVRDGRIKMQEPEGIKLRAKDTPLPVIYASTLDYEPWMDFATVTVRITTERFCEGIIKEMDLTVLEQVPNVVRAQRQPETATAATVIRRELTRTANVDFILDRTELRPWYHDNQKELNKIENTIDSVKADPDSKILGIKVKGWASPEGPYANNVRLAKGRTRSLRDYMIEHFNIDPTIITDEFEPEDWPGLRERVERATLEQLPHRDQILAMIDRTDLQPDRKEWLIRRTYPRDFEWLLEHVLPYLRHTDYTIDYEQKTTMGRREKPHANTNAMAVTTRPPDIELMPDCPEGFQPFKPVWALKTNMLFDLMLTPNFEIEVPFGKDREWSIMAEDWFPWFLFNRNRKADINPLRRQGEKAYRTAYELWAVGLEVRRWFGTCPGRRPMLTGTFAGIYAASGKYDIEWKGTGDQGEFLSFGATLGHSWVLNRRLNLEASVSGGVVFGPRRHYRGEFDDSHLIWQYNGHIFYAGPTKLKLSLVWLLGNPLKPIKALFGTKQKGGDE